MSIFKIQLYSIINNIFSYTSYFFLSRKETIDRATKMKHLFPIILSEEGIFQKTVIKIIFKFCTYPKTIQCLFEIEKLKIVGGEKKIV